MRVLTLTWEYPPHVVGGLGVHVRSLLPALARQGVEVTVVTPRLGGGEPLERTADGITVYRVQTDPQTSDIHGFAKLVNMKLQETAEGFWPSQDGADRNINYFDIIHAHDWLVAFAAVALKRIRRTPMLATMHATERGRRRGSLSGPLSQSINAIEWSLNYEAWRVITVSSAMAAELRDYLGVPPDKIDLVPNGVDTTRLDEPRGQDFTEFRARWARPDEALVLFVGRMEFEKGVHVLIESIPRVLEARHSTRFVLAGTGGMAESLKRRVVELGISDCVQLPGFVSDIERDLLFRVSNLAVFPSLYEPFGIVALEAMAANCPVIVTRVGGLPEVVTAGETGVVVNPDDPGLLAEAIMQSLNDPKAAATRAAAAYLVARQEFSWHIIARRTVDVYERVVSERAKVTWA